MRGEGKGEDVYSLGVLLSEFHECANEIRQSHYQEMLVAIENVGGLRANFQTRGWGSKEG